MNPRWPIEGRCNPREIRRIKPASCPQTFRATFLSSHSPDRLIPAVVWKHGDQIREPTGGRATPAPTATETGHPRPLYGSNRLRATGRVVARDVPSVVPWSSWKVECRDAPSSHPGDQRLRAQTSDGVEASGSMTAVQTAQALGGAGIPLHLPPSEQPQSRQAADRPPTPGCESRKRQLIGSGSRHVPTGCNRSIWM